jgi:hypothetical protein
VRLADVLLSVGALKKKNKPKQNKAKYLGYKLPNYPSQLLLEPLSRLAYKLSIKEDFF